MKRQQNASTFAYYALLPLTLLFVMLLASCNVTVQTGSSSDAETEPTISIQDQVATSVAATLTAEAVEAPANATPASTQAESSTSAPVATTPPPTVAPSDTPVPPTPTSAPPTATPAPPTNTPLALATMQPLVTIMPQVTILPIATPTPNLAPVLTLAPQVTIVPVITLAPTLPPAVRICDPLPATSFQGILNTHPALAADLGCPTSMHPQITPEAWEVQTAYQPFQHGAMLWSNKIGWYDQPVIYVMFSNGSYQRFDDTFNASVDPESGGETPPSGLYEPIRGFGKVWRNNPSVRNVLGWATAPENGGPGRFQIMEGGEIIWLSETNNTYIFDRVGGNTWRGFNVPFQP